MMFLANLLLTMAIIVMVVGWVNDDQSNFRFSCPKGQALNSIQSMYSNEKKYRLWDFGCTEITTHHSRTTCFQSGYFYRSFARSSIGCIRQEFIAGMNTRSHGDEEHDRRFGTICCIIEDKSVHSCTNSPFENEIYGRLNFSVPSGRVMTKINFVYDGNTRDRKFQFITCKLLGKTVK